MLSEYLKATDFSFHKRIIKLRSVKRKIVYVSLYEGLAILLSTLVFRAASDLNAGHAGLVALTASALAISWNYLYNTLFEALESRYSKGGRGFWLRTAHTLGFQLGMILLAIPLFALGLGLPKAQSLALQLTMSGFFVIYNFVFTLGFDRIFGLPPSAQKA